MNLRRGDIVLTFFPFSTGTMSSRRPVLVVQDDFYNQRLTNFIGAQITSNLSHAGEATHVLVELRTPEGLASGLLHDSVVSCVNLVTISKTRLDRIIGHLPELAMRRIDEALKAALGIV